MRQVANKILRSGLLTILLSTLQSAHAESTLSLDAPVLDFTLLQRFNVDAAKIGVESDYRLSYKENGAISEGAIFDAQRIIESGVLTTNFSATPDSHALTRLESNWTHPLADGKRLLSIGDSISNSGGWGDAVRFGGVRFGSSEAPRRDLITTPRLRSYGDAVVPSVADLILDKSRMTSDARPQFSTAGLPRVNGPDHLSLLVNDALGRTQVIDQPLTASSTLIAQGHSDYSIDIGKVRQDFGINSSQYGRWFTSSVLRYGLHKDVTLNWRAAQLNGETGVMGLGVNGKMGAAGIVSATVASSSGAQESGWLARLGYEYSDEALKFTVRHRVQSGGYKDIGANALTNSLKRRTLASVGVNMGTLGNFALTGAAQTYTDKEHGDIVAISHQLPVRSLGVISTAAAYSANANSNSSVLVSFTHRFTANNALRIPDAKQAANIFQPESVINALGPIVN